MKIYPFDHFKLRNFMTLLGIVVVTLALFLSSGQSPSWAAPEQNPQKQTVPPRPSPTSPISSQPTVEPTATPMPTSTSTTTTATTTASTPSTQDDDEDEDEKDEPRSQQTPDPENEPDDGEIIPSTPTENEQPNQDEPTSSEQPNQSSSEQSQDEESSSEFSEEADNPEIIPADLSLRKMVSHPTLTVGSIVTLTTVISNSGPGLATNVIIQDPLPITDLELLETTISEEGSYEAETGLWRIETIARSQSITMNLVVKVLEADTLNSTAAVIRVDQPDPDSIPNNNLETEDDQGSVSFVAMINSDAEPVQADDEPTTSDSASVSAPESVTLSSGGVDVLYWLYGLILGAVFIVIGVFLVHRS